MYFVLIILILIVVTMKQTFSTINIIKKKIHNYMKNDILTDFSILYIKRKIVTKFHTEKWYKGTSNSILIYQTPINLYLYFVCIFFLFLILEWSKNFCSSFGLPKQILGFVTTGWHLRKGLLLFGGVRCYLVILQLNN